MPLIVKPISAQLTKDGDFFGKAVQKYRFVGSLLRLHGWPVEAKDPET